MDNHRVAYDLKLLFKMLIAYAATTDGTTVAASPAPPAAEYDDPDVVIRLCCRV